MDKKDINFIQIFYKKDDFDVISKSKKNTMVISGYNTDFCFKVEHLYEFLGLVSDNDLEAIADKLLVDPIIQKYSINSDIQDSRYNDFYVIDVWLKNGVTDSVGETIERSIKTLEINGDIKVKTGIRYLVEKKYSIDIVENMIKKLFVNSVINEYFIKKV
jgi:phosphoribosylformylglycinamidine (FGAM) synthase PurS component